MSKLMTSCALVALLAGTAVGQNFREEQTFAGPFGTRALNDAGNTTLSVTFTETGYTARGVRILFDAASVNPATFDSEVAIRVTAPGGLPFTLRTTNSLVDEYVTASNLYAADVLIPPETGAGTWTFQLFESFWDSNPATGGDGGVDSNVTNFRVALIASGEPLATDIGTVGTTGTQTESVTSRTFAITNNNDVKWYKFTTGSDAPAGGTFYVDVDTELTDPAAATAANSSLTDTEIGLFNSDGTVRTSDDDDGTGLRSALSYGSTTVRDAVSGISGGAPAARDGRDGALPAGTYFVAVGSFDTGFATNFAAIPFEFDAAVTGDRVLSIRTNIPAPITCTCCSLSNVAGPNQSTTPDDALTADDIIVFLGWFFASDDRANVAGPNQSTIPDNALTADDIIVFLSRFFAGC